MMTHAPLQLAVMALILGGYFAWAVPAFPRAARWTAFGLGLQRRKSWSVASDMAQLGVAGLGQALLLLVLAITSGIDPMAGATASPVWILYGALLGVGEMAASALLVHLVISGLSRWLPGKAPSTMEEWIPLSRGGWMRYYFNTLRHARWPVMLALTVGYVAVEEMVFRGVLIGALREYGMFASVAISTALFGVGQVVATPSWRAAVFPVIGALVVGPIHGYLYFCVPDITPLIAAHVFFFFASVVE